MYTPRKGKQIDQGILLLFFSTSRAKNVVKV